MKQILAFISTILIVFVLAACNPVSGNGNVVTQDYDVSDFNRIEFSGIGDVFVTVGESESLSLSTDENLHDLMEIDVRGNTLHIGPRDNTNIMNSTELRFDISVVELEAINLSGAGTVDIEGIEADSFSVDASGATDISLRDFDLESLTIDVSGAGSATADGHAENLELTISGAGDFSGFDLETVNANVEISGAGGAEVNVSDELTGEISGAGSITYRGNPNVQVEQSGAGSVNAEN